MHFKKRYGSAVMGCKSSRGCSGLLILNPRVRILLKNALCMLVISFCLWQAPSDSHAELIDKVIAFVDETAITLLEFENAFNKARKTAPDISEKEVLNAMINRVLLLAEAKKLKIEAATDDDTINEYIDLKVKAFIRVREEDLEIFYNSNLSEFKGLSYESARDRIEEYLTEKETNNLLKKHIGELKAKAYIKIISQKP